LQYFVSKIIEAPDYPGFYHELDLSFKEKIAVISGAQKSTAINPRRLTRPACEAKQFQRRLCDGRTDATGCALRHLAGDKRGFLSRMYDCDVTNKWTKNNANDTRP
jgi:hypothetical protein